MVKEVLAKKGMAYAEGKNLRILFMSFNKTDRFTVLTASINGENSGKWMFTQIQLY